MFEIGWLAGIPESREPHVGREVSVVNAVQVLGSAIRLAEDVQCIAH